MFNSDTLDAINLAAQQVALLDRAGAFDPADTITVEDSSGIADDYDGSYLLRSVANTIAAIIGAHHGTGSWAASHALRKTTATNVADYLRAYGASPFLIECHAARITKIIKANAAKGGSR